MTRKDPPKLDLPEPSLRRRSVCRDLVPIPPGTCPACGSELHTGSSVQLGQGDYRSINPRRL